MQKNILWVVSVIFIAVLLGYGFWVFSPLLERPKVVINSPQEGEIISGTETVVRGEVTNVTKLYLNNTQLPISKSGTFEGRLAIWEGHTILILTGYDRFGRSVTVSRIIGTK